MRRSWLWVTLLIAACRSTPPVEVAAPELQELRADQVLVGVEHFMTSDGMRRAHMLADTAFFLGDSARVELRGLTVNFYDDEGKEVSVLTAASGSYDLQSEDMRADGSVVVRDEVQNRRLETERLRYSVAADELSGDTAFVFYRGRTVTRGQSFVSDPEMTSIRLKQPSLVAPSVEIPE